MINNSSEIGISIDAISHIEKDIFRLRLIPDFNSKFFMPAHTRHMLVKAELLEKQFLEWMNENHSFEAEKFRLEDARGSIVQGGYYILSKQNFKHHISSNEVQIFDRENDIFQEKKSESPYDESQIRGERMISVEENAPINISSDRDVNNKTYLYGFYVGQGDTLLLITSAKNAYLIDTNLYDPYFNQRVCEIKSTLKRHGMDEFRIKGLIITHKHADHIRGASELIHKAAFRFESLIMNFDYIHPTSIVEKFLKSAIQIPTWINLNKPCSIIEGQTKIHFKNPTKTTRLTPDINDSSVVMCVQHGINNIYLTGDACSSVLKKALNCKGCSCASDSVLKVSHHGSRTGTDDALIKMLTPAKAFVSAGYTRRYQHPHAECIDVLQREKVNFTISKVIGKTIEYQCNGTRIVQR